MKPSSGDDGAGEWGWQLQWSGYNQRSQIQREMRAQHCTDFAEEMRCGDDGIGTAAAAQQQRKRHFVI